MKPSAIATFIIISALCIGLYYQAKFVVGDDDQAVVTQFGKVVGAAKNVPGEYFKIPFIQKVHYFRKNLFQDTSSMLVPTKDKKITKIQTLIQWKIVDPIKYMEKINSYNLTKRLMWQIIGEAQREWITTHDFGGLVGDVESRGEFEKLNIDYSVQFELQQKVASLFPKYGLELVVLKMECSYPISEA
jgi:membrane protease subunit HflC